MKLSLPMGLALLTGSNLMAHDLYLMPAKFQLAAPEPLVVAVHLGDSFPVSEDSVSVGRLLNARATTGKATTPIVDLRAMSRRVFGLVKLEAAGGTWLSVQTQPNFIELAPDKFESYLREEGLEWVIAERAKRGETAKPGLENYRKHAKSFVQVGAPGGEALPALGLPLEFVPDVNLAGVREGDALAVRLLWNGQPAANVQVQAAWGPAGKSQHKALRTDAAGRVTVPLGASGAWRLHAVRMERSEAGQESDWMSNWASLTFSVGARSGGAAASEGRE